MKDEFDRWLTTDDGKRCMTYPVEGGSEYLKNRLWWAFQAGREAERASKEPPASVDAVQ